MLFQGFEALLILWIVLAIVVVTLVIYLAVKVVESEHKASDKKFFILLIAFIAVVVLPIVLGFIGAILGFLGDSLVFLRSLVGGGGQNFLVQLVPIIGFIILLALIKFLIDLTWESSLWVSLLTLFVLYIIFTLLPELTRMVPI